MRIDDRGDGPFPAEHGSRARLSAAGTPAADGRPERGPDPERVAEVRRRIREGAYGSTAVAGRVAAAVLRSGDL